MSMGWRKWCPISRLAHGPFKIHHIAIISRSITGSRKPSKIAMLQWQRSWSLSSPSALTLSLPDPLCCLLRASDFPFTLPRLHVCNALFRICSIHLDDHFSLEKILNRSVKETGEKRALFSAANQHTPHRTEYLASASGHPPACAVLYGFISSLASHCSLSSPAQEPFPSFGISGPSTTFSING